MVVVEDPNECDEWIQVIKTKISGNKSPSNSEAEKSQENVKSESQTTFFIGCRADY